MLGWHPSSCELFAIKIFINAREWPCESKAFHYFCHLVCQGNRPNIVFNRLGRHLFGRGEHICVFQRRRYNTFTQRGITHISNQWRNFKGELLEYYFRYTIWSRRFLDFCLLKSDTRYELGCTIFAFLCGAETTTYSTEQIWSFVWDECTWCRLNITFLFFYMLILHFRFVLI